MKIGELAGWYQVDDVRVSRELYQSSLTAKTDIMGNLVLMWYGQNGLGKDDPSDFKRFFSPCERRQIRGLSPRLRQVHHDCGRALFQLHRDQHGGRRKTHDHSVVLPGRGTGKTFFL
jgi:hypothetical protein